MQSLERSGDGRRVLIDAASRDFPHFRTQRTACNSLRMALGHDRSLQLFITIHLFAREPSVSFFASLRCLRFSCLQGTACGVYIGDGFFLGWITTISPVRLKSYIPHLDVSDSLALRR